MSSVASVSPAAAPPAPSPIEPIPSPHAVATPLLPVALAVTAGIVLDRYLNPPLVLAAVGLAGAAFAWLTGWRRQARASVLWLWLIAVFLGGAWHRVRHLPYPNDIRRYADEQGHLARLRGCVWADPEMPPPDPLPLRTVPNTGHTTVLVRAEQVVQEGNWQPAQGFVKLTINAPLTGIAVGDEVEVFGTLQTVPPPSNPGETNWQTFYQDQDIGGLLHAKTAEAVTVQQRASTWDAGTWLPRLRAWGVVTLREHLSEQRAGVAAALLLGDQSAIPAGPRNDYQRTGMFYLLVISGLHLMILCGAMGIWLRLLGLSSRRVAIMLAVFVCLYAILTGARPPVVRAAVVMCVWCGAWLVRRPVQPVNSLALAWLVITLLNPADLFQAGCQLSFLAVLALMVVARPMERYWRLEYPDPLKRLLVQSRPPWLRYLLGIFSRAMPGLTAAMIVWLACAPLIAADFHLVSPVAILLSVIMLPITGMTLVAALVFFLLSPLGLGAVSAWLIETGLAINDWSLRLGEHLPASYWYVSDIREWWLWIFYLVLLAVLLVPPLQRYWRRWLVVGAIWVGIGLLTHRVSPAPDGLRCTFLAVGHGGCVVLETPDGRVLLYDAGSMAGPEVTARQIAPYLWSRGITGIDEVFLSHADLDHFNGLPALLDRFRIGQVNRTPTFAGKAAPGVKYVTDLLTSRGVPVRVVSAGQRLRAGDLAILALHPPSDGPAGNENARSMVLYIEYAGHSLLLTGDLEQPGLGQVIAQTAPRIDVMLAPHHGSPASNVDDLARWANAKLVVSSEGHERGRRPDPYTPYGATVWRTALDGAVTVIFDKNGLRAESFRSNKTWRNSGSSTGASR